MGTGEFARLVPSIPETGGNSDNSDISRTKGEDGNLATGVSGGGGGSTGKIGRRSTGCGGDSVGGIGTTTAKNPQQQLLEELVPPDRKESLPGMGISFVDEDDIAGDKNADAAGGGQEGADIGGSGRTGGRGGRGLSVFERRSLEKARARQRDIMDAGEPQVRVCVICYEV